MLEKRTLFENGYIASKSSHSRGSTIDLTIIATDVDLARAHVPGSIMPSGDVDMGTAFDWFGPESHIQSTDQPPDVRANRLWLKDLMWDVGFTDYPAEWWHFTMVEEPFPDTYFDFPVAYPPPRANSVKKLLPSLLHDRDLRGIDHSSQGDLWEGSAHAT